MKLLRVTAEGLPLFKGELDLCFVAQQRVAEDDKDVLHSLFSNVYLNCSNAFIGINAAGKTSVLKFIYLALQILNNQPINHIQTREILGNTHEAVINSYFYSDSKEICKLQTIISAENNETEAVSYKILNETLWVKPESSVKSRKSLLDFSAYEPFLVRNDEEYLLDDVSIMIAYNKRINQKVRIASLLSLTNINVLPFSNEIPLEVISFLDPTIEKLYFDKQDEKMLIHLKFKGKEERVLNNPIELNQYLSSGTIKGIVVFTLASKVLKTGGYLVIDEIENHFNKEIVSTLIRFFMDSKLNKFGGTLFFTTHYPELLDEYDRNDSIHIIRNNNGIKVENLANILNRNDIKKSDAYQSGYLEGTTPIYESYMRLRKKITDSI